MAFKSVKSQCLTRFNTATSCNFLLDYESFWEQQIQSDLQRIPHQAIAPSSFRCDRRTWFRLRGTTPDKSVSRDKTLDFTSQVGTACHQNLQRNLKMMLKDNWISVSDFMKTKNYKFSYQLSNDDTGLETHVTILDPPVRLSVDGIIKLNGIYYLLEIKTSEYSSFSELHDAKDEHIDQVKCYASLLDIPNVLFLYQDRLYGELKCFEYKFDSYQLEQTYNKITEIVDYAKRNLAPPRLPKGDKWCASCPYSITCKQWG